LIVNAAIFSKAIFSKAIFDAMTLNLEKDTIHWELLSFFGGFTLR